MILILYAVKGNKEDHMTVNDMLTKMYGRKVHVSVGINIYMVEASRFVRYMNDNLI